MHDIPLGTRVLFWHGSHCLGGQVVASHPSAPGLVKVHVDRATAQGVAVGRFLGWDFYAPAHAVFQEAE